MPSLNKQSGQIAVPQIITWGLGIAIFAGGTLLASVNHTDGQVEMIRNENSATLQRVAKLEEAITTIKSDNAEIKADVKAVLRELK